MKKKDHTLYMAQALKQAKKAFKKNEVPIGAVVVNKEGIIIGRGYNKTEHGKCQTAHAEVIAIQKACKKIGDWRLNDCWLYVTLEPCIMCFGLIQLSRIKGIVFGVESPLFGFGYKKYKTIHIKQKNLLIEEGVAQEACTKMLQDFFKSLRKKGADEAKKNIF